MAWDYKLIDHTADIAAEISGDTLRDLLYAGYAAWRESVAEEYPGAGKEEKQLEFTENSFEELLVGFLSELNYILLLDKWIPSQINVISFESSGDNFAALIKVKGRIPDPQENILKSEIKAVTFHQMEIKNISGKFSTLIVFDI